MVHLERIHEEIRVLNIKDETLLSYYMELSWVFYPIVKL